MQTLVSTKYQIVIPKEVRDKLEIHPGQKFEIETKGKKIILSKPMEWPDDYFKELGGLWKKTDIKKFIEEERNSWD